ncbi:VIT1/CCC1 transporter family protein [Methylophilus aquaticus]|uniref:VIT family protein n=1 Tax=Methylophilus aquaticus TaxID=1971610 RepID=A0ABT9JST5_9PROT|nr:VIT family protein [Methylophilus aquaticus]MDP8567622.1 VIT family protein [Methylophilus aquaticus]
MKHHETHRLHRSGWLRAAVLGANDGIISTASLLMGVAAANASASMLLTTGVAGLVAGALSMAAGEYVSVSSQADIEQADLQRETQELRDDPESELRELTGIYMARGLPSPLATQVAQALTAHDPLAAHARDELGIHAQHAAQPLQAALASAIAFAAGAALPLATAICASRSDITYWLAASTLLFLAILGATAAKAGGANVLKGTTRVLVWGVVAMGFTALIGHWFGVQTL